MINPAREGRPEDFVDHCRLSTVDEEASFAREPEPALTSEEYFPEHFQFLRDVLTEQENEMVDAINQLDCKIGRDRLNALNAMSRINGVLAV